MDQSIEIFCLADPTFFEAIERRDDAASRFPASLRPAPAGWRRGEDGLWVAFQPEHVNLAPQGWKIHVSASLGDAAEIAEIVWERCVRRGVAFKLLRSRDGFLFTNSKYADRGGSGKLATVYPAGDEELEAVVGELRSVLDGRPGPYILSDLRCGPGPVHVRYGGFLGRFLVSDTGDLVPAIEDPDGRLVADPRGPVFRKPRWAPVPGFVAAELAAAKGGAAGDFPYQIERALHFSNGGGVYAATDKRTGREVVLKEARPLAGLDQSGADAVARQERERAMLDRLAGLDCVPALLDQVTWWEHQFLVEELVDGETLADRIVDQHPLVRADATPERLARYTRWALGLLDDVERAVDAVHERGVVIGDLHPGNIMLTPAGRVVLIDLELATPVEEANEPGLGHPGFASLAHRRGFDLDRYALDCLRLAVFLPLTELLQHDPGKGAALVDAVAERFPVPAPLVARLRARFGAGTPRRPANGGPAKGHVPGTNGRPGTGTTDRDALRRSIAGGILASATPERADRLFPGDVEQFHYGGWTLANGAAGVLYALAATGVEPPAEHVDWLAAAARRARSPHAGLYSGLHGAAFALERLGRLDDALSLLDRAVQLTGDDFPATGLYGGTAGMALNLLHLSAVAGERDLEAAAMRLVDRLAEATRSAAGADEPPPGGAGLLHGATGSALLFLRLFERDGDQDYLDLATASLRRDLAHCEHVDDGSIQVREGKRLLPYLGTGSAGIGLVLDQLLAHRPDDRFEAVRAGIRRACTPELVALAGLFNGRSGLMAYLGGGGVPARTLAGGRGSALDRHLARLTWHAAPFRDHVAFAGDHLIRLSMDLATGSAGVLLALGAVLDARPLPLPFLQSHKPPAHDRREEVTTGGVHPRPAGHGGRVRPDSGRQEGRQEHAQPASLLMTD